MGRYIVKRLLWLIPVMIGVITIIFIISALTPGDVTATILGESATVEQRDALRQELGLDLPLIQRWFNYIKNIVLHFDFGRSYTTGQPIKNEILNHLPTTIKLAFITTILGALLGVPLGILAALKQNTWIDGLILFFSVLLISMPNFWLALLLISEFSVQLKILPSFGIGTWQQWVLPVCAATLGALTGNTRLTRSCMLEVKRQDYIRTARAKGQKEGRIVFKHMLRNAMIPIANGIGGGLGSALGGNMTLEVVFALPGLGYYIASSITTKNHPAMLGGILFTAMIFTLTNLILDLVYVLIDPRLKSKMTGTKMSRRKFQRLMKEQGGLD